MFVIARRHFVARIASRLEVDAGEAEWGSVGIILAPDKRYHNLMCYYSVLSVEVLRVSLHVHTSILYIHTTCILIFYRKARWKYYQLPALVIVSASIWITTTCNLHLGSMVSRAVMTSACLLFLAPDEARTNGSESRLCALWRLQGWPGRWAISPDSRILCTDLVLLLDIPVVGTTLPRRLLAP